MEDEIKRPYYEELVRNDVIDFLKPLLEKRGYKLRWGDGKLVAEYRMLHEVPWIYVRSPEHYDCHLWHNVIFDVVSTKTANRFVPTKCQSCWKVVARPKTLAGLFAIGDIQQNILTQYSCKHGIERRPTVHGLYGAYWYNSSIEDGLKCYEDVREEVNKHEDLGEDIPVLLKRGCTEFELACGPSDKWRTSKEQVRLEEMIERNIVRDFVLQKQPDHLVRHVHRQWIEFAYENGDETYKRYTDGKPLFRPYVTYHHLLDELNKNGKIDVESILNQKQKEEKVEEQ
jgi:hypothetical protein